LLGACNCTGFGWKSVNYFVPFKDECLVVWSSESWCGRHLSVLRRTILSCYLWGSS